MKAPRFTRWFANLGSLNQPPRKRGGTANRRGISRELDCILIARP